MGAPLTFIGPDGMRYQVDSDAPVSTFEEAHRKGYRLETEAAPRTWGEAARGASTRVAETVATGAAGAIEGATFGLSKPLTKHVEEAIPESYPVAKGIGEFGGMLLSPLNKVGTAAKAVSGLGKAATVTGRLAGMGLEGATIGALSGAGAAVGDALAENADLNAEKVLMSTGLGAALGTAGGVLGGALTEGAAAALPHIESATGKAKDALSGFAEERWLKASGAVQKEISKIPQQEHGNVADIIRRNLGMSGDLEEALAKTTAEREATEQALLKQAGLDVPDLKHGLAKDEAVEVLQAAQNKDGEMLGGFLKKADAAGAKADYQGFANRFQQFQAELNPAERDLIKPQLEKVDEYLQEVLTHPDPKHSGFSALNDLKSTLQKDTNWVSDGAAKYGLKRQVTGILRDELDAQLERQVGPELMGEFVDAKRRFGLLKTAEEALKSKKATGTDAMRAVIAKAELASPEVQHFANLGHAQDMLKRGMDRTLGNRFISLSDYLVGIGAGVSGDPVAGTQFLKGLATSFGHKIARERGSAVVATLADKIAESPHLMAIANGFAKRAAASTAAFGPYAQRVTQSLAAGPARALAEHMMTAQTDPEYQAHAAMAGFVPEDSEQHGAALAKAHSVAQIAANVAEADRAIERHVDRILKGDRAPPVVGGGSDFGGRSGRKAATELHDKRADEVLALAADPAAMVDRLSRNLGNLGNVAPGMSAAMSATSGRAVDFLAKAVQAPPPRGPLAPKWVPSEAEKAKFARLYHAVVDPESILQHAAAGTMTQDEVAALKAVYPALHSDIQNKMLHRLTSGASMPYRQKLMVSMLLGGSADGSSSPQSVAANQTAISQAKKKETGLSDTKGGATPSKADKLTVANRTATPAVRREMRED